MPDTPPVNVGDRFSVADGFHANGMPRPRRTVTVIEHSPPMWARVEYADTGEQMTLCPGVFLISPVAS
jgi:hypothetical protein